MSWWWSGSGNNANTPPQEGAGSVGAADGDGSNPPPNAEGGGMFSGAFSFMKGVLGMEQLKVEDAGGGENKTDIDEGQRKGLISQMANYIGKDITSMISLPVWIFEPLSFLQIMSEPLQYDFLLQLV
jgi:hypothetical protein